MADWRYDVFLCHASSDEEAARDLYSRLKAAGLQVYLAVEDLKPGDKWDIEIPQALRSSRVTAALVSSANNAAWYEKDEIALAIRLDHDPAKEHRVVPIVLEPVDDLYGLHRLVPIRAYEVGFDETARRLIQLAAEDGAVPEPEPPDPSPSPTQKHRWPLAVAGVAACGVIAWLVLAQPWATSTAPNATPVAPEAREATSATASTPAPDPAATTPATTRTSSESSGSCDADAFAIAARSLIAERAVQATWVDRDGDCQHDNYERNVTGTRLDDPSDPCSGCHPTPLTEQIGWFRSGECDELNGRPDQNWSGQTVIACVIDPEVNLDFALFVEADLRGLAITGGQHTDVNFSRSSLVGADLSGAEFDGADFRHADLTAATIRSANLSNVKLDQANLTGARISDIECPDGAIDWGTPVGEPASITAAPNCGRPD